MVKKDGIYKQRGIAAEYYARDVRWPIPLRALLRILNFASFQRKHVIAAPIDVSREAQLRDIEASFAECNDNFSLEQLEHPNKPGVTALDSYPILPDVDIWANQYDLFRFSERPGDRPVDVRVSSLLYHSRRAH